MDSTFVGEWENSSISSFSDFRVLLIKDFFQNDMVMEEVKG